MTAEQFCYWMQGFVELNGKQPSEEQWESIKEHLKTVFNKVTPPLTYKTTYTDTTDLTKALQGFRTRDPLPAIIC